MKFMNLKQGSLSVRVYSLKFNKLSKNIIHLVTDPQARIDKFVLRLSNLVNKECHTTILTREMDISWLMSYDKNLRERILGREKWGSSRGLVLKVGSMVLRWRKWLFPIMLQISR